MIVDSGLDFLGQSVLNFCANHSMQIRCACPGTKSVSRLLVLCQNCWKTSSNCFNPGTNNV